MAERGDLPRIFAAVHRGFRTPHVSIVCYAVLTWLLAANGSFLKNLTLSVVARLITYGLVLRGGAGAAVAGRTPRAAPPAQFRMPAGPIVAALGVAGMIVIATQVSRAEAIILAIVVVLASVHWSVVRGQRSVTGNR
jgi:APA family basic amino acid/polyamine antiporter